MHCQQCCSEMDTASLVLFLLGQTNLSLIKMRQSPVSTALLHEGERGREADCCSEIPIPLKTNKGHGAIQIKVTKMLSQASTTCGSKLDPTVQRRKCYK